MDIEERNFGKQYNECKMALVGGRPWPPRSAGPEARPGELFS